MKDCGRRAVRDAMRFLTDEWLCDVLADYPSKCVAVAAALTIIERSLLPDRPAFFVTAGRRGAGKTTLIIMLIMAVTGVWPTASAWSSNEEERRKALLSYFMHGVPYILWDNIPRGAQISCPHIERSCTAAYYADRKLGVSQMVATAASTIHFFTGNNIGPRGELASRSLHIRLEVDRTDPENRSFRHPDPIEWTKTHRAEILRALYTILIGNPMLDKPQRRANEDAIQNVVPPRRFGGRTCRQTGRRGDRLPKSVSESRGRRRGGNITRRSAQLDVANLAEKVQCASCVQDDQRGCRGRSGVTARLLLPVVAGAKGIRQVNRVETQAACRGAGIERRDDLGFEVARWSER